MFKDLPPYDCNEAHNANAKEDQKDVPPSEEGIAWLANGIIEKNETGTEGIMA